MNKLIMKSGRALPVVSVSGRGGMLMVELPNGQRVGIPREHVARLESGGARQQAADQRGEYFDAPGWGAIKQWGYDKPGFQQGPVGGATRWNDRAHDEAQLRWYEMTGRDRVPSNEVEMVTAVDLDGNYIRNDHEALKMRHQLEKARREYHELGGFP